MTGEPPSAFEAAWARFVQRYRATRAPAALRQRILALIGAAGGGRERGRGAGIARGRAARQ